MTSTMQIWLNDAKDFGVSLCLQKGFLFCLGFEIAINPHGISLETLKTAAGRVSENATPVPDGAWCDFDDGSIEKLLYEAGEKSLGGEFRPRTISGPRAKKQIQLLGGPPSIEQLPDVGDGMLCEWGRFLSTTYEKVGRHLSDNGERAFLAGIVYASALHGIDQDTTRQLAVILSTGRPPHLHWFSELIYCDDKFVQSTKHLLPVQKSLFMLAGPASTNFPCTTNAAIELLDEICLNDNEFLGEEVSDFCLRLSLKEIHFDEKISEVERKALKTSGYEEPLALANKLDCGNHIAGIIKKKFNYDVLANDVSSVGEGHTQKSCIILATVASSLLNPGWNKFV